MSYERVKDQQAEHLFAHWEGRVEPSAIAKASTTLRFARGAKNVATGVSLSPDLALLYAQELHSEIRTAIRMHVALRTTQQVMHARNRGHQDALRTASLAMDALFEQLSQKRAIYKKALQRAEARTDREMYRALNAALRRMNLESPEEWRDVFNRVYHENFSPQKYRG